MKASAKYKSYKDSGIEWIGSVPNNWDVKKLKYCCSINSYALQEETDPQLEIKYVDIGSVSQGKINKVESHLFKDAPFWARRLAQKGDTIVSTVRTYLKAISYIEEEYADCVFSTGFSILSPYDFFNSKFFSYSLQSYPFINEVVRYSKGVSFPTITSWELDNFNIAIPSKNEQEKIANFLDRKTAEIDQAITQKQRLIKLFKEQKAILIDRSVMGGLKPNINESSVKIDLIDKIQAHWKVVRLKTLIKKWIKAGLHNASIIQQRMTSGEF
jgi:type I restriction enzyme, S subunit